MGPLMCVVGAATAAGCWLLPRAGWPLFFSPLTPFLTPPRQLQPNDIDLWDCKGSSPGADRNEEFFFNTSSGEIVSLDTNPCCLGMCLGL